MSHRRFFICMLVFCQSFNAGILLQAQSHEQEIKPAARMVSEYKSVYSYPEKKQLFSITTNRSDEALKALKKFTTLTLDQALLSAMYSEAVGGYELIIPYKDQYLDVELVKVELITGDFKVVTDHSNNIGLTYIPGIFYRGIVKGDNHSVVAFSFFEHELSGMISTDEGNIIVGKMQNGDPETRDYIVYTDRDFNEAHLETCATDENPAYGPQLLKYIESGSLIRNNNCVRLYYEVDNDIYQHSGSTVSNTMNWLSAVQNDVAALYANDGINVALSEVFIWTFPDPYHFSPSESQLYNFKIFRSSFNGDIGQLITMEQGMLGGAATKVNGLCSPADKYCYSDVDYEFHTVPIYSWTVNVIAHEFGHLMGSYHTHNCIWPGGAIDDCGPIAGYPNEGNCPLGPNPVNGGTIMSYCHLTGFGINFNNGFGPLPSDAIRGAVNEATCLTESCIPDSSSYCKSHGKTAGEWIESIKVNGFINSSGQGPGYSNFTDNLIQLHPGSTVNFTLSPGYAATHYDENFSVWIDYNKDLNFYGANENVFKSISSNVPVTGTFTVPTGVTGITRMRISMKFDTLPTPCESFKYGEVEDYSISLQPAITYCESGGKDASKEWIDKVQFGSIHRESSSDSGYYDGTAMSSMLSLNSVNTIIFSAGFSGLKYNEFWKAWIDYDGDGTFEGNEKIIEKSTSKDGNIIRTFTVPATASAGKTRMRISMKRRSDPSSCESFLYGETEDYSVMIGPQDVAVMKTSIPQIILYPNPAFEKIIASFNEPLSGGSAEVMDIMGHTVIIIPIVEGAPFTTIPVSDLEPGIYLLRIKSGDRSVGVLKWMKM